MISASDTPSLPTQKHSRRRFVVFLILLLVGGTLTAGGWRTAAGPASGATIQNSTWSHSTTQPIFRVATFNIHSGIGADGQFNLSRTADALRRFDVIAMQEVRGGSPDQSAALGQLLTMPNLYAPTERQWWHDAFGNALLCSLPVENWQRIPLAGSFGRGCKNVLFAKIVIGEKTINVLATHIDRGRDHDEQLRTIIELFLSLSEPAIAMGDFNAEATDPQIRRLHNLANVDDPVAKIMGDKMPKDRIDWIFTRGLKCRDAGMKDNGASDHPLAWAELELTR